MSNAPPSRLLEEELKVTVLRLTATAQTDPYTDIADLLIDKKDLSFQDMKGTGRAFEDVCGVTMPKNEELNDIIAAQSFRHAIVHSGEVTTTQTMRQLGSALPRRLKRQVAVNERIRFDPDEVDLVAMAMEGYLSNLATLVSEAMAS
jgi:hypothetical protein